MASITFWNRLEPRPRSNSIRESLAARIRDPLWLLTRQWQMGEFRGDDAGSPIKAKVHIETAGAEPGIYYVTVQGDGGGQSKSVELALVVN